MYLTMRELLCIIHGMVFVAVFHLAYAGGLAVLYSLEPEFLSGSGVKKILYRMKLALLDFIMRSKLGLKKILYRMKLGLWVLAIVFWVAVIRRTFIVYIMFFGAIFLVAYAGGLAGLYSLKPGFLSGYGLKKMLYRMKLGLWVMAIVSWVADITGTFIVYIWYRAKPIEGADLTLFPRSFLLSNPETSAWHTFGMEWKEHVTWIVPFLATSVAYVVSRYGETLVYESKIRKALIILFTLAFFAAAVGTLLGVLITKIAPVK